ncbi:hypothetical protein EIP86_001273 [Pleurotus ostreatoroseus]|nr:hypothetical protein EIP86_001273 [Pleurotus ostreatoroseus]
MLNAAKETGRTADDPGTLPDIATDGDDGYGRVHAGCRVAPRAFVVRFRVSSLGLLTHPRTHRLPPHRARPHLRPLDLAASPKLTHKSSFSSSASLSSPSAAASLSLAYPLFALGGASPRRSGTGSGGLGPLLTPPLTPSSSFASSEGEASAGTSSVGERGRDRDRDRYNDLGREGEGKGDGVMPGTPPEGGSPLRWANISYGRKDLKERETLARRRSGYFTPREGGGGGSPLDLGLDLGFGAGVGGRGGIGGTTLAELSARFGRMEAGEGGAEDVTPRMEKTFCLEKTEEGDVGRDKERERMVREFEDVLREDAEGGEGEATRFLLILNIPKTTPPQALRRAFGGADVKGILVRFLAPLGAVFLAYYDVRAAARARRAVQGRVFADISCGSGSIGDEREPDTLGESGSGGSAGAGAGTPMDARCVSARGMARLLGPSAFVAEMDGACVVRVEGRTVLPADVQRLMGSFGEVMAFQAVGGQSDGQAFRVEYFDVRQRDAAFAQLDGRTMFGARLRLSVDAPAGSLDALATASASFPSLAGASSGLDSPFSGSGGKTRHEIDLASPPRSPVGGRVPFPDTPSPVRRRDVEIAAEFRVRPRSVSASESMGCPDAVKRLRRGREREEGSLIAAEAESPGLFLDPIEKVPAAPLSPDRQRSVSMGPEGAGLPRFGAEADAYQAGYYGYHPIQHAHLHHEQLAAGAAYPYAYDYSGYAHVPPHHPHPHPQMQMQMQAQAQVAWPGAYPPAAEYDYYGAAARQGYPPTPHAEEQSGGWRGLHARQVRRVHGPNPAYDETFDGLGGAGGAGGGAEGSPKNQLDLAAIESGMDTRTTVMIKNIPNKMTDRDLMTFINRVCPRRIDFLYLRMDFQNGECGVGCAWGSMGDWVADGGFLSFGAGCNVGYAFVNFITVEDLLYFARTQLGVKWNMYSSEKALQLSYANYQGKEALVEKFKNSCIMDEREAWRPKIFYSDGPHQGLSEPFPPPTHLRRKERSASNRGALFVPGAHHYAQYQENGHGQGRGRGFGGRGAAAGAGRGGGRGGNGRGADMGEEGWRYEAENERAPRFKS